MILGIDPGAHGAMAFLDSKVGNPIETYSFAKMTESEIASMVRSRMQFLEMAFLEKVGARPGQGVTSMFSFGQSCGFIRGVLVACKIPFEYVTPQKWQAGVGLKSGLEKPERKRRLKQMAQEIYPYHHITLDNADAIMIARYGLKQTRVKPGFWDDL